MKNRPTEILKPVRYHFILLTFLIAIVLELIPLPYGSIRWLPDFIGVLILYWVTHEPRQVNIGFAFMLGLIADLINTGVFGQHALAYSIMAYLAFIGHKQLAMYNILQQMLVICGLLLYSTIIMFVVRFLMGSSLVTWSYFLPPLFGALIWPVIARLSRMTYRLPPAWD